ncbi:MAG: ABC transporter permease [Thermoplasmatota archaeon]
MAAANVGATERLGFLRLNPSRVRSLRRGLRLFRSSPLAMVGFCIVAFVLLLALVGPFLSVQHPRTVFLQGAPHEEWPIQFDQRLQAPSFVHPFGTTAEGYDLYSMVLYGAYLSLRIGLIVVVADIIVGVALGALAGYYGGAIDEVIMRTTDVFLSIPSLLLALAVAAALGASVDHEMMALAVVQWPIYTRLIRGAVLSARENQYVEAARSIGASDFRIIRRHLLPNVFSPVVVQATLDVGTTILAVAGLSYLGLGAPPGTAEWGLLVAQGVGYFPTHWWYVTFPGIAITVTVLGFNLLGDGLRDIFDPKLRK